MTPRSNRHLPRRTFGRLAGLALGAGLVALVAVPVSAASSGVVSPAALTWSTLSPPASPPPLANASAAFDRDNKTIVMFGGLESAGRLSNDTWVWNGSTWFDYSPAQIDAPPARQFASMAFDPDLHQLILFGGRGSAGQMLGDTWAWNGASWYNVGGRQAAAAPSQREGASLSYDGRGHLILFGGDGTASQASPLPDTAPTTPPGSAETTTTIPAPSQSSGSPEETPAASPTPGPAVALGDTWQWGPAGWTQLAVPGPPARTLASATYDSVHAVMLLFGGTSTPNAGSGSTLLQDTWTWDGDSWAAVSPADSPSPRHSSFASDDPVAGGAVLFGGYTGTATLADTWVWNGTGWTAAAVAVSPPGRSGSTGGFDTASRQLTLFGGTSVAGRQLGDTLVLTAVGQVTPGPGTSLPGSVPQTTIPATPGPSATPPGKGPGGAIGSRPGGSGSASAAGGPRITPGGDASSGASGRDVVHRGDLVQLSGSGFSPRVGVTVSFHSTPTLVGRTTTDGQGSFSLTVAVPQDAAPGLHHFEATGETPSGTATRQLAAVEVIGAPSARSAPTPAQTASLLVIALALPACTWLALVFGGRVKQRKVRA